MRLSTLYSLLFTVGFAGLLLVGCALPRELPGTGVGERVGVTRTPVPTVTPGPAPVLALPTLEGDEASLEMWRGKGVIVNFWATWCYPCRIEMPDLQALHEKYGDELVVVGVNYEEEAAEAAAFIAELGVSFPI
ncbi:MAG: TlpA family protein disulfide reductase, partial [Ardenticatenaceae bacterium]